MSDEKIRNAIHSAFDSVVGPENVSIFSKLNGTIYVIIQKPSSSCAYLELYISASEENKNNIHVHTLDNCDEETKGRDFLMLVEELAQRIGSKQITLLDASRIKWGSQSVSLKTLYNLTTGQSWYNSLGYICLDNQYGSHAVNYEDNKRKIRTTKVSDFIEEVKDKTHDTLTEKMIDDLFVEITNAHHELNPEMNIQDYFTIVKKMLRERSSPAVFLLIKLLFNIEASDAISTSISDCLLVKEMDTSPLIKDIKRQTMSGGRSNKNKKTKKKFRKYKRSRKNKY